MFKKIIILNIVLIFSGFVSFCQELKIVDFNHLEGNTTARINKVEDVNGQNCSLLILKHNFNDFEVKSRKGVEKMDRKTGETWLWLSPDEYQLVLRKEGYIPLTFDLKDKLTPLETFELTVTDEYGIIFVKAPGALIWLDNSAAGYNEYKFRLKEGKYIIKATRENYYIDEKFVVLNAGDSVSVFLDLKPKENAIISNTNEEDEVSGLVKVLAPGAKIWLDYKQVGTDSVTLKLKPDKYALKATRDNYSDKEEFIILNAGDNLNLNYDLEPIVTDDEVLNTKSNYTLLGIGYGTGYGSKWGARLGFVVGEKMRVGFNGAIGINDKHVQYCAGLRFYVYRDWAIIAQYGTNGNRYYDATGEFSRLEKGPSLLFGYDWFRSEHIGVSWGLGGFYSIIDENIVLVADVGIIFRF